MNYINGYDNSNNINSLYSDLARLQNATKPAYRTVFTDINNEWNSCSAEEQKFILSDEVYVNTSAEYQQQFSAFLLEMFGAQFAASQYGPSAEKVLAAIKDARKRFKDQFAQNAKNIEEQNRMLLESNKKLAEELKAFKELLGEK